TSRDEDDRAFGVYVGYAITPRFGIELAYTDLGETRYTEDRDVPSPTLPFPPPFDDVFFRDAIVPEREQTTIESESLSLSLIGRYPLTEALFVVGRAGITVHRSETNIRFWFNENETTVINGASENSDGAVNLGIGIEWDFHRHWHARLQLQRNFALEDEECIAQVVRGAATPLTAGVAYRSGRERGPIDRSCPRRFLLRAPVPALARHAAAAKISISAVGFGGRDPR